MKERKRQRRKVKEKREKSEYAVCPPALCKHLVPQVYNSLLSQGTKIGRRDVRLYQIAFKLTYNLPLYTSQPLPGDDFKSY